MAGVWNIDKQTTGRPFWPRFGSLNFLFVPKKMLITAEENLHHFPCHLPFPVFDFLKNHISWIFSPSYSPRNLLSRNFHLALYPKTCPNRKLTEGLPRIVNHACACWQPESGKQQKRKTSSDDNSFLGGLKSKKKMGKMENFEARLPVSIQRKTLIFWSLHWGKKSIHWGRRSQKKSQKSFWLLLEGSGGGAGTPQSMQKNTYIYTKKWSRQWQ